MEREEPGSIGQFWFNCTVVDGGVTDKWPTVKNGGRGTTGKAAGRNGKILQTAAVDDESSSAAAAVVASHNVWRRLLLLFTLVAASTIAGVRF